MHQSSGIHHRPIAATYVLPIAAMTPQLQPLTGYLARLSRTISEVIVIDGSSPDVFAAHARTWSRYVRHVRPNFQTTNGKVAGVLTGVCLASNEAVVLADDDVRYKRAELVRLIELLHAYEVVRPQNYFRPLPWHARWDTARSLYSRLGSGDWPGTLGIQRSALLVAGGYSGEVLFENFEMVQTICAAGGRELVAADLFVARRPPSTAHFLSQRVRQAYDEWSRPARYAGQLALLPGGLLAGVQFGLTPLAAAVVVAICVAEVGRRKASGTRVFGAGSALWGPAWICERAVTSWLAFGMRLRGGVRYRSGRIKHAATPLRELKRQMSGSDGRSGPDPIPSGQVIDAAV